MESSPVRGSGTGDAGSPSATSPKRPTTTTTLLAPLGSLTPPNIFNNYFILFGAMIKFVLFAFIYK
jgi:hypothetical protein